MEGSTRNAGASVSGSTSATALARSWKVLCADALAGASLAFGGFAGWTVETALALSHPAAAAAAFAGALAWELAEDDDGGDEVAAGAFWGGGVAGGAALDACGVCNPVGGCAAFLISALVVLSLQRSRSLTSSCPL